MGANPDEQGGQVPRGSRTRSIIGPMHSTTTPTTTPSDPGTPGKPASNPQPPLAATGGLLPTTAGVLGHLLLVTGAFAFANRRRTAQH